MDVRQQFIDLWGKYFGDAPLPIGWYYSEPFEAGDEPLASTSSRCVIGHLLQVQAGKTLVLDAETVGCPTVLGLEMLLNQAALQFETWTHVEAPREIMRQALIAALQPDA